MHMNVGIVSSIRPFCSPASHLTYSTCCCPPCPRFERTLRKNTPCTASSLANEPRVSAVAAAVQTRWEVMLFIWWSALQATTPLYSNEKMFFPVSPSGFICCSNVRKVLVYRGGIASAYDDHILADTCHPRWRPSAT